FHWSFDLEILPFPSYRKFAKELIDAGVNVVVGCHSHCIQGGELYKEGVIVYGLGNFFIPWNTYVNGEMTYPDFSKQELGLEWDLKTNQFYLHWFEIQGKDLATELLYQGKTTLDDDKFLKYAQPYKLSDQEYLTFFKKNRRKKVFIPVFTEYKGMKYSINMSLLKTRARVARTLAKYKLRKWNN
ncbi:MAG: CapA family protein, partial [Flavobacterium sp.]